MQQNPRYCEMRQITFISPRCDCLKIFRLKQVFSVGNCSVAAKLNTKQKNFRHFCIFIVDYEVSVLFIVLFFLFLAEPRGQDCQKCFTTHLSANFLGSPKFVKRHSDDKLRVNVVLKHLQQLCNNFLFPNMFFSSFFFLIND